MYRDAWVQVSGDRLYVYHSYLLEVLGANGTFLYRIPDVSDPPALDDKGNVYVMQGGRSPDPEFNQGIQGAWDNDGLVPSGTLESYDSDGKLRWKTEVNGTLSRQDIDRTALSPREAISRCTMAADCCTCHWRTVLQRWIPAEMSCGPRTLRIT